MRATQWMEEDEGIAYISIFTECVFYTFTFRNSIDYCCAQLDSSVPIRIVCPMPFLISAKSLQLNVRLFIRRRWFHAVRNHLKLHTSVRLDSNRGVSTELWQKTADHPSSRNCLFFCFVLSLSFIHRHAMPCHAIPFDSFHFRARSLRFLWPFAHLFCHPLWSFDGIVSHFIWWCSCQIDSFSIDALTIRTSHLVGRAWSRRIDRAYKITFFRFLLKISFFVIRHSYSL